MDAILDPVLHGSPKRHKLNKSQRKRWKIEQGLASEEQGLGDE